MAISLEGLKDKVRGHGLALHGVALIGVLADLDTEVPDSDRTGTAANSSGRGAQHVKLRTSRVVSTSRLDGDVVTCSVGYTAPHASITNEGPDPHTIPTGGREAQRKKGYPLHWLEGGTDVYALEVFWTPGALTAANVGWFDRGLSNWSGRLQDATDTVRS